MDKLIEDIACWRARSLGGRMSEDIVNDVKSGNGKDKVDVNSVAIPKKEAKHTAIEDKYKPR